MVFSRDVGAIGEGLLLLGFQFEEIRLASYLAHSKWPAGPHDCVGRGATDKAGHDRVAAARPTGGQSRGGAGGAGDSAKHGKQNARAARAGHAPRKKNRRDEGAMGGPQDGMA